MGVVHGVLQWLNTHLYRSLCGSSEWCMCLYISGSTPTYRGVKMGMVHSTCAYIAWVIHPLIQGFMWVFCMVFVPI